MDFSLNDHQTLIRDTVRQFMETEVRPFVKEWEKQEKFPAEAIQKLGEIGCCGMLTSEEYGGPGLDTISYVLMLEEVARVHTAMSTAIGVTNSAVQAPLLMFGNDAQKKKYLRRMATGETLGAFCLTESAAGSDAAGIQATAHRVKLGVGASAPTSPAPHTSADPGLQPRARSAAEELPRDVYLLNGTKTWVTNGNAAGVLIVFAKTDPAAGGRGISAFLVEPSFQGFRRGRHEEKMGQHSSPSVEILLNDCVVPMENRLGEEGQGLKIALSALDGGRIGIAAQGVGLAQGALEETIKYAKQRKAFGKSIGEFQAIQWMIADMQTEIEAARGLTHYAAWLKDAHPTKLGAASSKAKLYASEMVNRVVYKAVQVHGSVGYSRETDVERMYRDARVLTIYEGTSEVQRMIIARELLGEGAKQKVATN
jgi:alkylation response protein AidB-like acyl-CoA dehydrogenase